MRVLLTLTFLLALFELVFGKWLCPPSSYIRPCDCLYGGKPVTYQCSKIMDQDTIEQVIKNTFDWPIDAITFKDSSLLYINKTLIESKEISLLEIDSCSFTTLFNSAPAKGSKIFSLTLRDTTFTRGLDWKLFQNLPLSFIEISNVPLKRIRTSFIANVQPTLMTLQLERAGIESLHAGAFSKLTKVWELSLAFNSIRDIKRSMFPRDTTLSLMDFSHNKIEILPDDIFSNMPRLEQVHLNDNQIQAFTPVVWEGVFHQLKEVALDNNPILCDCKVKWYTKMSRSVKVTGKCDSPGYFKGKDLFDLTEEDFVYCRH